MQNEFGTCHINTALETSFTKNVSNVDDDITKTKIKTKRSNKRNEYISDTFRKYYFIRNVCVDIVPQNLASKQIFFRLSNYTLIL